MPLLANDRTDAAPRVVPRNPAVLRAPFFLAFILAPFNFGWRVLAGVFDATLWLLAFLPRPLWPRAVQNAAARRSYGRRQLASKDAAARFKRELVEQYGGAINSLPFFEGSFSRAYDLAKTELKFLLVVLIAPEHDDTEAFVRDVLLSPEVASLVQDPDGNIILWGGNVLDAEAYQVFQDYNCTAFPWSAVVCLTPKEGSTRMGAVRRLAGNMRAADYVADIRDTVAKRKPDLDAVRAERQSQEWTRNLRAEQDSAYERSLAIDRERARQKKEADAAAAEAEKQALEKERAAELREDKYRQWRRWRASTVPAEPPADAKNITRLALKLPPSMGGESIRRPFYSETTLGDLYAFVECYDILHKVASDEKVNPPDDYEHEYSFRIASLMPREVFEPTEAITLGAQIGRSGNVIVEDIEVDWETEA